MQWGIAYPPSLSPSYPWCEQDLILAHLKQQDETLPVELASEKRPCNKNLLNVTVLIYIYCTGHSASHICKYDFIFPF